MFAAIDQMLRMVEPQSRGEKTMATGRAMKRQDEHECGHIFTWRLWTGAEDTVTFTLWTGKLTIHMRRVYRRPVCLMATCLAVRTTLSTVSHHPFKATPHSIAYPCTIKASPLQSS